MSRQLKLTLFDRDFLNRILPIQQQLRDAAASRYDLAGVRSDNDRLLIVYDNEDKGYRGMTIWNALSFCTNQPDLFHWFGKSIHGRPGSFVLDPRTKLYDSYAEIERYHEEQDIEYLYCSDFAEELKAVEANSGVPRSDLSQAATA
jgi:hypothetical protein